MTWDLNGTKNKKKGFAKLKTKETTENFHWVQNKRGKNGVWDTKRKKKNK